MISLKKAPRYLIIANALKDALFILPVLVLFYADKGVSIGDFFLIQGINGLAIFLLEIPTGYMGDLFSRRQNLLVSYVCFALAYTCYILAGGFWGLLGAELMFAVAYSIHSGTAQAYLYDLVKKNHKENKMHEKLSKFETVRNSVLLGATLSGAFIYQLWGGAIALGLSMGCVLIGFCIIYFLPDVPESCRQVAKDKSKWQDVLDLSKYALKHPEIKWLILFPAVYGTATLTLMWGIQPVMMAAAVPVFMFSLMVGCNAFMRTVFSAVAGQIFNKLNLNGVIKLLWVIIFIAFVGAVFATKVSPLFVYVCLGLMIAGSASAVLSSVITSTLVNHRIASDERATILSVKSMVSRLLSGIGMIALKPLFDTVGAQYTFMICLLLLIPIVWVSYPLMKLKLSVR